MYLAMGITALWLLIIVILANMILRAKRETFGVQKELNEMEASHKKRIERIKFLAKHRRSLHGE